MPKFDLTKVQNFLAKAQENRVRVDSNTYFRNTYFFPGLEAQDLGEDIEFVYRGVHLRRFKDSESNDNRHAGFTFTEHAQGRAKLRQAIAAFDKLDRILGSKLEVEEPTEVTITELEDCTNG